MNVAVPLVALLVVLAFGQTTATRTLAVAAIAFVAAGLGLEGARPRARRHLRARFHDGVEVPPLRELGPRTWLALLFDVGGRGLLRARWDAWTVLPGTRLRDPIRKAQGLVVDVTRPGRATLLVTSDEAVRRSRRDPLDVARPSAAPVGPPRPYLVDDPDAPGGVRIEPAAWREVDVDLARWVRA